MKTKSSAITIGLDLGDRKHAVCVLDARGEILKQESIANTRPSLTALSRRHPGALVVMELGMHSPWTSRLLKELGHRVLVANPRKVRAIYQNERKSDRKDAEILARLGRSDEKLLHPVEHVCEDHCFRLKHRAAAPHPAERPLDRVWVRPPVRGLLPSRPPGERGEVLPSTYQLQPNDSQPLPEFVLK